MMMDEGSNAYSDNGGRYNDDEYGADERPRIRRDTTGEAVLCRPLEVQVRDNKVEQAIRQLKNRLAREGILRELKNRRHYLKPSEVKRIKRREAARRRRKQVRQRY
jgi:small subunit ribosomal protein S21